MTRRSGGAPSLRVAFVPVKDDWNAASARLRVFLPIEHLRAAGVDASRCEPSAVAAGDLVVFSKCYGPEQQSLAREFRRRGARPLLDLCDNHFWVPDDAPHLQELADELRRMLELVDGVSVASEALRDVVARERPELPLAVVEDAFDPMETPLLERLRRWLHKRDRRSLRLHGRGLRLCWFGHHGDVAPPFGLIDLERLLPTLAEVHAQAPLQLTVITGSKARFDERIAAHARVPVRFRQWRRDTFRQLLAQHDACVLPIGDNPFTRCKSANRPLLALHAGVPVVADPLPSYQPLAAWVRFGTFGAALRELATEPLAWRAATRAGQQHVRAEWTPVRVVRQWTEWLSRFVPVAACAPEHAADA